MIDIFTLPVIGAFIGYFTNYVAIKMLFYPKRAYYLGSFRVPFTPGLIPKKRNELIDKISEVVAEKVINKKELVKYIYSKKNREFLYSYTRNLLEDVGNRKISSVGIPYKNVERWILGVLDEYVEPFLEKKLDRFDLDVDYITYNAFLFVDKNRQVKDFLGDALREKINRNVEAISIKTLDNLSDSLQDRQIKELIKEKIAESLNSYIDESNILTASFVSMIAPLIEENDRIIDIVVERLQSLLKDRNIQLRVRDSILRSLEDEVLSLKLEEFLIKVSEKDLEQTRRAISEKLKEIVHSMSLKEKIKLEILNSIDKREVARKITAVLRASLNKYTFFDVLDILKPGTRDKLARFIVNNLILIIKRQSQRIFDFDIAANAKKRLETLDIGQVEDIILDISKEQFRYIDFFGGVLGFLIGIIEVIIR